LPPGRRMGPGDGAAEGEDILVEDLAGARAVPTEGDPNGASRINENYTFDDLSKQLYDAALQSQREDLVAPQGVGRGPRGSLVQVGTCMLAPAELEHAILRDEEPAGESSPLSATVNLLATTMGAGLLSLPHAFAKCGVGVGVLLILLCGCCNDVTLQFLVVCGRSSQLYTFEGNAQHYLGNLGRRAINGSLLLLLFLGAVSCLLIVMQLLSEFMEEASGQPHALYCNRYFIGVFCLCLVLPLCLREDITILRYTSAIALCNLCYFLACLNIRFWGQDGGPAIHPSVTAYNTNPVEVLQGLSIMLAAYICHFNMFEIDGELSRPAKRKIWGIIHVSISGIATTTYCTCGVVGYLLFGKHVNNNILREFPQDRLMMLALASISLTNIFKLPLIIQPLRTSVNEAMPQGVPRCKVSLTVGLFVLVFMAAVALGNLGKALSILGCTAGTMIAIVMPSLLRLALEWSRRRVSRAGALIEHPGILMAPECHSKCVRLGAWALIVGASLSSVGAVIGIVVDWNRAD